MPLEEALDICKQIAAGLECAHEKPIVHRDLKPANIKVSSEGVVKILDFGLARAFSGDNASTDPADSPALSAMTAPGTILGTAAYISPEQARGKKVDKRTDIWALGCVLYELLTGQQAFQSRPALRDEQAANPGAAHPSPERKRGVVLNPRGVPSPAQPPVADAKRHIDVGSGSDRDTIADIIGAILYKEPDWTALPETIPPHIRVVLRRCLEKDAKRRFHAATDVAIALEEPWSVAIPEAPPAAAVPCPGKLAATAPMVRGCSPQHRHRPCHLELANAATTVCAAACGHAADQRDAGKLRASRSSHFSGREPPCLCGDWWRGPASLHPGVG
ncbi:MAG: serine/threonine-protein kinase [Terriglobia bacterium]